MKLVFLGTSELAAASLRAIYESRHEVTLVATQPDRGAGRGRKPNPPPVKVEANALGLDVVQPESVNTRAFRALVKDHAPDVFVVAAFGQIIRPLLLALPPRGCLNRHASILPRHRGASPINAAILAGDEEVGVSIMKLDEGMDTGPVGLIGRTPARPLETAGELHDRLATMGADLIVQALDLMANDALEFHPQDESQATHAPKLSKSDGLVDWHRPAAMVARQICGLTPWPGCFGTMASEGGNKSVIIGAIDVREGNNDESPGKILEANKKGVLVACAEGAILIRKLKPAGKRMMSAADFLNGTRIKPGDRFEGATHG